MKKGLKRFLIAMLIMVLLGAVAIGIGCAVFFGTGGGASAKINYQFNEAHLGVVPDTIDLDIGGYHKVRFEDYDGTDGTKVLVTYYNSEISTFIVTEGTTLRIAERRKNWGWWRDLLYKEEQTEVVIKLPATAKFELKGDLSGAVDVDLPAREYGDINFSISGAGNISGTGLIVGDVKIHTSGASNVNLTGDFQKMDFDTSGASNYKIIGTATELKVSMSGASNLEFGNFYCPDINMRCSGGSNVKMNGTGERLRLDTSGTVTLKAENFTLLTATVVTSGSSKVTLRVSKELSVSGSGSSKVSYYGDPKVTQSGSGSFTLTDMD